MRNATAINGTAFRLLIFLVRACHVPRLLRCSNSRLAAELPFAAFYVTCDSRIRSRTTFLHAVVPKFGPKSSKLRPDPPQSRRSPPITRITSFPRLFTLFVARHLQSRWRLISLPSQQASSALLSCHTGGTLTGAPDLSLPRCLPVRAGPEARLWSGGKFPCSSQFLPHFIALSLFSTRVSLLFSIVCRTSLQNTRGVGSPLLFMGRCLPGGL